MTATFVKCSGTSGSCLRPDGFLKYNSKSKQYDIGTMYHIVQKYNKENIKEFSTEFYQKTCPFNVNTADPSYLSPKLPKFSS